MKKVLLNGQEVTVQERQDWTSCIEDNFKPGDYFCEEIAWELINAVPPHRMSYGYFQCGEPHSHRPDRDGKLRQTFLTLRKVKSQPEEIWQFLGYCFTGEETERQ